MDDATTAADNQKGAHRSILREPDRWLFWPAATLFVTAVYVILICGLPGMVSFILIPLVVLGWPIVAIVLLIPAGLLAKRGMKRKAISVALAVMLPILLWKPIFWVADCAHIALTAGLGAGQLGSTSPSENDRFAAYDWSVGLAGSNTSLIYDATDEIALPPDQHKYPISAEKGFGEECAGRVDHVIGHFYKCSF